MKFRLKSPFRESLFVVKIIKMSTDITAIAMHNNDKRRCLFRACINLIKKSTAGVQCFFDSLLLKIILTPLCSN